VFIVISLGDTSDTVVAGDLLFGFAEKQEHGFPVQCSHMIFKQLYLVRPEMPGMDSESC